MYRKLLFIITFFTTLSPSILGQQYQKITGSSSNFSNSRLGRNIAIDDSLALAISDRHINTSTGPGAFFYKKINGTWTEQQVISNLGTSFGTGQTYTVSGSCIALQGTQAFIGSWGYSNGNVYVYSYNGTTWSLTQTITVQANRFGRALHVDGNTMVITSEEDSYIYTFDGTNWNQQTTIAEVGNNFGTSVFVNGNTISVLDGGLAAYIYDFTNNVLSAPQTINLAGANTSAIEGNKMLIGSQTHEYNGQTNAGKVFIYEKSGSTWNLTDSLQPNSLGTNDRYFGCSVGFIYDKIVVGQNQYNNTRGKAYIFEKVGNNWTETNLTPLDITTGDYYSRRISYDSKNVMISSALDDDNGANSGSVYIYDFCSSTGPNQTHEVCSGDSVLIAGNYYSSNTTFTETLANFRGCDSTIEHTVTIINSPTVIANTTSSTICQGETVTLSGSGAVSYSWDNNVTDNSAFTPNTTQTYSVTGMAANGCSASDNITITVNTLPNINANASSTTVCQGDNVTLFGTGGTSYFWNNNVTDGVSFTPSQTNTYTITGSDGNCTNTDQITITVENTPTININASATTICNGETVTLNATGNATTYSWDNNIQNNVGFQPNSTSNYIVTATQGNCSSTDNITITVNQLPIVNALTNTDTLCSGEEVILTSNGTATSYSWDNNITEGTAFSPSQTTTYTVTGTDANCSNSDQVTIVVELTPTVSISASSTQICQGESVTLSGTGNSNTYTWDNAVTDNTPFTPNATLLYTVSGQLGNCSAEDTITITVNELPVVNAVASDTSICEETNVTLTATGNADTYSWDNNVVDGVSFVPTQTATYTVTGVNSNCSATAYVTITVEDCSNTNENNFINTNIYPNPTSEILFIETNSQIDKISLIDLTGKQINTETTLINNSTHRLSLSELPKGVYFIILEANKNRITKKVIKK